MVKLQKLGDDLYVPENFSRYHHYYADPNGDKEYTGITTVLGVIAKPALIGWAARMAVEYIDNLAVDHDDGDRFIKTSKTSWAAFLEEARTAHAKKRDTAAEAGTDLHALVEEWVTDCIETNEGKPLAAAPDSIAPFFKWAHDSDIRFLAAEKRLYSKTHWIAGTCDLIFEKDGKRYIGDIKTYKKIWDRVPLIQCAGYALMWEEMHTQPAPNFIGPEQDYHNSDEFTVTDKIDGYCVICLPKERDFNESEDVIWSYDTEGDTEAFLSALRLYRYLNQK